jgi:Type II secretion system (T2SS), protein E, N-terminal domain
MASTLTQSEEAQLAQTIEMFEVITESQPHDYQSLEILKEAYSKLGREKDVVRTAKRIAEAYVDMGQLSSAILEYETILQRCPDDPDVQKALKQIESKASNFSDGEALVEPEMPKPAPAAAKSSKTPERNGTGPVEDGRQSMVKVFVESKIIAASDFDLCWNVAPSSKGVVEPFIQVLADKGILPIDKSLKILSDKSRTAFLPLEKYDIDIELSRTFPGDVCRRWCVLPFDRMSKSVLVATANPFNQEAVKELSAATPHRLLWYLSTPAELVKVLQKIFR